MLEAIHVRHRHTAGFEPPAGRFATVQFWDCCGPYADALPGLPRCERRVLQAALRFLDVDPETPGRDLCRYVGEANDFGRGRGLTPAAARDFWGVLGLATHLGATALVVHCAAGLSRSISAAMAVADRLGLPRTAIDWQSIEGDLGLRVGGDPPNRHVYRTVFAAHPAPAEAT